MTIGISFELLFRLLKNIKESDSINFYILINDTGTLYFNIFNIHINSVTSLKLIDLDKIEIPQSLIFDYVFTIPLITYHENCGDLHNVSTCVKVYAENDFLYFVSNGAGDIFLNFINISIFM